jgi:hypothetical protein
VVVLVNWPCNHLNRQHNLMCLLCYCSRLLQLSFSYSLNRGARILLIHVVQSLRTYLFALCVDRHVESVILIGITAGCKAVALSHTSHVLIGNTVTSFLSLYLTFVPRPLLVVPNRARSCSVLCDLSVFPVLAEQVSTFF